MDVLIEGKVYNVKFVHEKHGTLFRTTYCHIDNLVGLSMCSKGDNFSRSTGRKISLARALQHFPREVRKLFWEEYFRKHKR